MKDSGVILLCHECENVKLDEASRFEFIPQAQLNDLAKEDIYSWGDFCWIDYNTKRFPEIPKNEIAEALYFRHKAEPFDQIRLPSLKNRFLSCAHDDGWFLKMYYELWIDIVKIIDCHELSCDQNKLLEGLVKVKMHTGYLRN